VVVACEPNPLVLDRLRANLKLNRANEVIVSSAAILDREADVDFFIPSPDEPNQMIATLGGDAPNITHPRRVQIPGITLDLLMDRSEITTVDLIKIDVEGFEEFVLAGARTTLRCHRPNLIFEYAEQSWTRAGSSLHRVLSDLRAVGYGDAFYLARDGLKRLASAPPPYTDIVVPRDGRAPRRRHSPEGPQTG
jgi:FkbM family methyltransferase